MKIKVNKQHGVTFLPYREIVLDLGGSFIKEMSATYEGKVVRFQPYNSNTLVSYDFKKLKSGEQSIEIFDMAVKLRKFRSDRGQMRRTRKLPPKHHLETLIKTSSQADIARHYGVSRQAVHQALQD